MRTNSRTVVGSPTARVAAVMAATLLLAVALSTLLLGRLDVLYVVVVLFAFLAFGVLGMLDDWASWLPKFKKVMPVDYRRALMEMQTQQERAKSAA